MPKPAINYGCAKCGSTQTFIMTNEWWEAGHVVNIATKGEVFRLEYTCVGCGDVKVYFIVKIADDLKSVTKVGQFPAWEITGDPAVERLLGGERRHYLRRALVSESQGYGIGAFAYYRRIVEEIIDELLTEIAELIGPDDRDRFQAALAQAKRTRVAAEKIDLVKDLLPPILRPDGMNPLKTLHETLSEGLHAESDERCLGLAMEVREIIIFLATQVASSRQAAKSFTASMRSLLEKRSGRAPAG